jgi:hypothetical protein
LEKKREAEHPTAITRFGRKVSHVVSIERFLEKPAGTTIKPSDIFLEFYKQKSVME